MKRLSKSDIDKDVPERNADHKRGPFADRGCQRRAKRLLPL